jgi:integrase
MSVNVGQTIKKPGSVSWNRASICENLVGVAGVAPTRSPRSAGSLHWTCAIVPRELRHSFVSLLSDAGVPIERISRLVGHSGTSTTETVYRKQIRPVITHGADAMDRIFPREADRDA